jgi:hypothetical protein
MRYAKVSPQRQTFPSRERGCGAVLTFRYSFHPAAFDVYQNEAFLFRDHLALGRKRFGARRR